MEPTADQPVADQPAANQPVNGQPIVEQPTAEQPINQVEIKVRNKDNEIWFKVKPTTSLARIKTAYCTRVGKDVKNVRFLFEGQRVQDTDTPDSLGMENSDTIDVFEEQIGGADNPADNSITITVRDVQGQEIAFKIKPHTQLGKVMNAYREKKGLSRQAVRFLIDGTQINDDNTPASLELEDGDIIEVFLEQLGGYGLEDVDL
ncbi:ubiquitin-like protein [Tothia fuscella]|uniref:Ubiquitin-like protein n=1 Tax=Tothia fuscella TaxID=1048955 RepID=A0A9P4U491_9PEZI|nr:ubiquitin-like protein [Tothia fuscella]